MIVVMINDHDFTRADSDEAGKSIVMEVPEWINTNVISIYLSIYLFIYHNHNLEHRQDDDNDDDDHHYHDRIITITSSQSLPSSSSSSSSLYAPVCTKECQLTIIVSNVNGAALSSSFTALVIVLVIVLSF
jgi:hypothetical protein